MQHTRTTATDARDQEGAPRLTTAGLMRRFLGYYQGQMHLFVGDIACAVVVAGIDLAFPQILRTLTGGLFTQGADAILGALGYLAAGLLAMYAVRFACRYFVAYWGHVMGARMESRMREDLFAAYQRMSFSFFDRNKSGDLMSRLVSDLFDISETAHHGPEFLLIGAVEIVGSFLILGFVNVPLTLVLAAVLVVLTAYNLRANLRMKAVFRENRVRISGVNSRVEDSLAGIRVVKGFAAEDVEKDKFRTSNDAYLDSKVRMYRAMGTYQAGIAAAGPCDVRAVHHALHHPDRQHPELHGDVPEGHRGVPPLRGGPGGGAGHLGRAGGTAAFRHPWRHQLPGRALLVRRGPGGPARPRPHRGARQHGGARGPVRRR